MYRIDNSTSTGSLASPSAPGPNPDSYFTKGDPGLSIPATIVDDEFLNMIQEEIVNAVLGAGLSLSKSTRTQLRDAIRLGAGGHYKHTQGSANTTWTITHNLGTKDHIIQFYNDADDSQLIPDTITRGTSSDTVTWAEAQDGIALLVKVA